VLEERFRIVGLKADDVRIDFLGLNAIHGKATPKDAPEPYEIAVRVAARTRTREEANKVGREVDGMAVSGIGCTGKRVPHADRVREVIGVWSSLVAREQTATRGYLPRELTACESCCSTSPTRARETRATPPT
jgi:hypothetical protein